MWWVGILNPEGDRCLWVGLREYQNLSKPVPRLSLCLLVLNTKNPTQEEQEVVMEFIFSFQGESVV